MSKIINFNELKEKKLQKRHIIYLIFFIILIYIIYSIYLIVKSPNETLIVEKRSTNFRRIECRIYYKERNSVKRR